MLPKGQLLPCPLCAGNNIVRPHIGIKCNDCDLHIGYCKDPDSFDAETKWNTRNGIEAWDSKENKYTVQLTENDFEFIRTVCAEWLLESKWDEFFKNDMTEAFEFFNFHATRILKKILTVEQYNELLKQPGISDYYSIL